MNQLKKIALLFPGQGSQYSGMGKDLFEKDKAACATFAQVDQFAGRSLSQLCFSGTEEELKRTIDTQPTILAVSLAAWSAYEAAGCPSPQFVAGHSLGEFTALAAAKSLSYQSVVKLVELRAQLMEQCPKGAMAAILGMKKEDLELLCSSVRQELQNTNNIVIIANFNTHEQLVISGAPEAVALVSTKAKSQGSKAIPLPVGGAFHSPLMESAAKQFEAELAQCDFLDACFPVIQNFDGKEAIKSNDLRLKLAKQMSNAVKWCDSIEYMIAQGVDTFIEIGPGKVLTGMVKRISRSACVYNIFDMESLQQTLEAVKVTSHV